MYNHLFLFSELINGVALYDDKNNRVTESRVNICFMCIVSELFLLVVVDV